MRILGITDGITSGAAILEDGRILAAVNEERLCRKKMAIGFPRQSIDRVLELTSTSPAQVDRVAVATKDVHFYDEIMEWKGWFETKKGTPRGLFQDIASAWSPVLSKLPGAREAYYWLRKPFFHQRRKRIRQILESEFGIRKPVRFMDHHFAHAASAYFASGEDECLTVSMDGGGDGCSAHVYRVKGGEFEKLQEVSSFDSLANYYMYGTHLCGFKGQKHEGKVTGLAAHGEPLYFNMLQGLISANNGHIRNHAGVVFSGAVEKLRAELPRQFRIQDLAASLQMHLEHNALQFILSWLRKTGIRSLALAGGIFANVRLNQKLHELGEVDKIFVFPGMSDEGLAVGAALGLYALKRDPMAGFQPQMLSDVYLGPSYSETDMEHALKRHGLNFSRVPNIEKKTAQTLREGYLVARFDGRLEFGPRALGNRSVLFNPTEPSVNEWLNAALHRTEFMPFAPATIFEHAGQCFHGVSGAAETARFMTITFDCTDWMKQHCRGVVHVDGTARPQLVKAEDNPSYYQILKHFHELTKLPSIINTSFNMHEEPIVCSPDDALRAFLSAGLDFLILGPFWVENPKPLTEGRRNPIQPQSLP